MGVRGVRAGGLAASVLALALLGSLALAASAVAAAPPVLWQSCDGGEGAGQCSIPRGIAADPSNGHVYVGDLLNQRIDEFTAWGEFVKAWGWDVDGSGAGTLTAAAALRSVFLDKYAGVPICRSSEAREGEGHRETVLTTTAPPPFVECVVLKVKGLGLSKAKEALAGAHCKVGKVTKPKARKGKKLGSLVVQSSTPREGSTVAESTKVSLTLGPKPKRGKK